MNSNPTIRASLARTALFAGLCISGIALSGCAESGEGDVTAQDIQNQAAETVETTRAFAQDQVETYKESLMERVNVVDAQIEMLESRAATLSGEAKQEVQQAIDELKTSKDQFMQRVEDAQADSEAAWDDLKSGLDSAWDDLKSSAEEAADRFGG